MSRSDRNAHIGSVYVGPYVDGRQGAVLLVGDTIAHLTPEQCCQLARKLEDCAAPSKAAT